MALYSSSFRHLKSIVSFINSVGYFGVHACAYAGDIDVTVLMPERDCHHGYREELNVRLVLPKLLSLCAPVDLGQHFGLASAWLPAPAILFLRQRLGAAPPTLKGRDSSSREASAIGKKA